MLFLPNSTISHLPILVVAALIVAHTARADIAPTSTLCDVAIMDDPLNFKTIYKNRGQSKPQPLPPGTHTMCDYYDSEAYVGKGKPLGTCCTGDFVDEVIFPLHKQVIEKGHLTEQCTAALERVACFACARDQTNFLSFQWNTEHLSKSAAEIRLCRKTCHTIYEHCKGESFFHLEDDSVKMSEDLLCDILDTEISLKLAQKGTKLDVVIVDDDSERPACFMYDDLEPEASSYEPKPLDNINPGTDHYRMVFKERMRRVEGLDGDDRKSENVVLLRRVSDKKVVATVKGADAVNAIQIITTNTLDDTVQIVFSTGDLQSKACLLDASGDKVKYELVIVDNVIEDLQGNSFHGVADTKWQFATNGETNCQSNAYANSDIDNQQPGSGEWWIAALIAVGTIFVFAIGYVYYSKRNSANAYANQVDFGDDMVIESNTTVEEGTTVVAKTGEKFQVRLVPEYESPNGTSVSEVSVEPAGAEADTSTSAGVSLGASI